MRPVVALSLLLFIMIVVATPATAHVLLDAEAAQPLLAEIAAELRQTRNGAGDGARLEALYRLAEAVARLVEIMNFDLLAHGQSVAADLLARRLGEAGIRVAYVERSRRFVYDLAPLREYLMLAPAGPRAGDVKFRLIAHAFHRSAGARLAEVVDGDLDGLREAVRREEDFVREHPTHPRLRDVRFFLAVDYYRLHRNSPHAATARRYGALARAALVALARDYPGTAEARSAETVLEDLPADP
jgi:hypothetical protein